MKIMLLASGDLWAGAEAVVYQLAKGLHRQGEAEVMVVCLNRGRLAELLASAGIKTIVIDEAVRGFWGVSRKLSIAARGFRPDIIHAHRYKENILAALISPFCQFPQLVTTIHGISEVERNVTRKFIALIEGAILRHRYARVVAVSQDLVCYLVQKKRISFRKVTRIYNGLEVKPAHKDNMGRKVITIGSAGRLVPVKDFELMIDVARELCTKRENVRFVLAGDGPERKSLQERAQFFGLGSCFIFLGHVDDMENYYNRIDIYLNTSRHEGMPMTFIEAMSQYLPIVAPDVGGIGEIVIDKETGILIRGRDSREFVEALNLLIDSPALIDSMGLKARARAEGIFSCISMVNGYFSLYSQVLMKNRLV